MPPAGHSVTGTLADKPQCDCFSKAGSGDAVAESRCPPDKRRDHPASRPMSECRAGAAPPIGRTSPWRARSEAVRTGSETRRTAHYRGRRSVPRRTRRRTTRTGSASRRGSEQCPRGSGATFPKAFTGAEADRPKSGRRRASLQIRSPSRRSHGGTDARDGGAAATLACRLPPQGQDRPRRHRTFRDGTPSRPKRRSGRDLRARSAHKICKGVR